MTRALPDRRLVVTAAAGWLVAVAVAAAAAGVWSEPQIHLSGLEVDADGNRRVLHPGRTMSVVLGETTWRPVEIAASLVPGPPASAAPTRVAIHVEGATDRAVALNGRTDVRVDLPRLRGLAVANRVDLRLENGSGPIFVRDVSASVRLEATLLMTFAYAGLVGAWAGWTLAARRVDGPAAADSANWRGSSGAFRLALIGAGIAIVRRPDAFLQPQLWAEDGAVFLRDAYLFGTGAILSPYSGYLHVFPRLVAVAASALPRETVPLAFNLLSAAPLILVAWLLASRRLPLTTTERVLCMALTVLPPMPGEVILNVTNTPWLLGVALVLLWLSTPADTPRVRAAEAFLAALSSLSGPIVIVMAPLFAWRALSRRTVGTAVQALVVAGGAALQGVVLRASGRLTAGEVAPLDVAMSHIGQRLAVIAHAKVSEDAGFVLVTIVIGLCVLAGLALALERSWLAAACATTGVLVMAAVVMGARGLPGALAVGGERYFALPLMLLLWSAVFAMRRYPRLVVGIALVLVVAAPGVFVPALPDLRWHEASACLESGAPCHIPINPAGWSIDLTSRETAGERR